MVHKTVVFSKDAYLTLLRYAREECEKCECCFASDLQREEAEASFSVWKKIYECLLGVDED